MGAIVVVKEYVLVTPAFYITHQDPEDQREEVYFTVIAVMTVMSWFWVQVALCVSITQLEIAKQASVINVMFGCTALLSGVFISKAQLDTSIGGWIADINPLFHGISIVYVAAFGTRSTKCEYSSNVFNCGVLNPMNEDPETMLLGFGMRTTDLDMSYTIVRTSALEYNDSTIVSVVFDAALFASSPRFYHSAFDLFAHLSNTPCSLHFRCTAIGWELSS